MVYVISLTDGRTVRTFPRHIPAMRWVRRNDPYCTRYGIRYNDPATTL